MYPEPVYPYPEQTLPYAYAAPSGKDYDQVCAAFGVLLDVLLAYAGTVLSAIDQKEALGAEEIVYQAPLGQLVVWKGPQTGYSGTYEALRDGRDQDGFYCREYQMTLSINDQETEAKAKACLDEDGFWRLASGRADLSGSLLSAVLSASGQDLLPIDQATALQTEEIAYMAPFGRLIVWGNPETGNSGTYTALRDFYNMSGLYCREYNLTLSADGKASQAKAASCVNANEQWTLEKSF